MASAVASTRRSQASRSANSRSVILDAAVDLLVERGYCGTTTIAVQERAGVTRGRLLHHFPSRDAMLVAAAKRLADQRIVEMERWFDRAEDLKPAGTERVDHAVTQLWSTFQQPYFWAAMELWSAARTDAALRDELASSERRLGRAITHVIATMFGPVHSSHPAFDEVRDLLFSSMRGVALTYSIVERDPATEPHLEIWCSMARRMLDVESDENT
ncbi:TetR/AcrR family transcriptional regulator [Mycobacterium sp. BMJ-28]